MVYFWLVCVSFTVFVWGTSDLVVAIFVDWWFSSCLALFASRVEVFSVCDLFVFVWLVLLFGFGVVFSGFSAWICV